MTCYIHRNKYENFSKLLVGNCASQKQWRNIFQVLKEKKLSAQNSISSKYLSKKLKEKWRLSQTKIKFIASQLALQEKKKVKENYLGRRNMIPDSNLDLHKEIEIQKVKIYLFFLLLLAVKDSCLMQKQ